MDDPQNLDQGTNEVQNLSQPQALMSSGSQGGTVQDPTHLQGNVQTSVPQGQDQTVFNQRPQAREVNVNASAQYQPAQTASVPVSPSAAGSDTSEKEESVAMKDYRKQSEQFRKEREIIKAREVDTNLSKRLGALAMPFIFIAILMLIVVFIFIPYSTEIVETRNNTRALLKDIERNEDKIDTLTNIDLTKLDRHLEVTSLVVRDSMDVTEMAIEVERLALKHSLEPRQQRTSNIEDVVVQSSTINAEWVPSYADVISGPFNYEGTFANVISFIKDLRNNSKTILSLGQIQIIRTTRGTEENLENNDQDYWVVGLLVSGYTAEPVTTLAVADPIRTNVDLAVLGQIYSRAGESFEGEEETEGGSEVGTEGESFDEAEIME